MVTKVRFTSKSLCYCCAFLGVLHALKRAPFFSREHEQETEVAETITYVRLIGWFRWKVEHFFKRDSDNMVCLDWFVCLLGGLLAQSHPMIAHSFRLLRHSTLDSLCSSGAVSQAFVSGVYVDSLCNLKAFVICEYLYLVSREHCRDNCCTFNVCICTIKHGLPQVPYLAPCIFSWQ
jgi:hypothetical protein